LVPSLRILGGLHGDEWSSSEVAFAVAKTFLERDGSDALVTELLDRATVYVFPWVNPDGMMEGSRYNAVGIDLNRNFDFAWSPTASRAGPDPFSEPETRAIRTHALLSPSTASLSFHAGATNIGYVWNYSTDAAPGEPILKDLAHAYAEACATDGFSALNGADWYVSTGDTNDWSYGRYGGMDFTVEVTTEKSPPDTTIDRFVDEHLNSALLFLATRPTLSGRVVDDATGTPLSATLFLARHGKRTSPDFATDPTSGAFARFGVEPGARVAIWAPGFSRMNVAATLDAPLEIRLQRERIPESTWSTRVRGEATVAVPGRPRGTLALWRMGAPGARFPIGAGGARVDTHGLAPGPWTVRLEDGTTRPNALFVADDGVRIDAVEWEPSAVRLDAEGFAPGTRAFGLWAPLRQLVELPVLAEEPSLVRFDASALPATTGVDLLIVSNGSMQAVLDLFGEPDFDTQALVAQSVEEPMPTTTPERKGCVTNPLSKPVLPGWALFLVAPLMRFRRPADLSCGSLCRAPPDRRN
jgi:hypothetical protein